MQIAKEQWSLFAVEMEPVTATLALLAVIAQVLSCNVPFADGPRKTL